VRNLIARAAFMALLPRIDWPVIEQPGHLLKAPVSVHPLTNKLAVPVPSDELRDFDPNAVPKWCGCAFDNPDAAAQAMKMF
jgi:hypothetical protein